VRAEARGGKEDCPRFAMYGLPTSARCAASVGACRDASRWLVATTALKAENEVHLLELEEGSNRLECRGVFAHRGEVWDVAASPNDENLFFTVFNDGGSRDAALWEANDGKLNAKFETKGKQRDLRRVVWSPEAGISEQVALASGDGVKIWDLSRDGGVVSCATGLGELENVLAASWNPLDHNVLCASCSDTLRCLDLRTMTETVTIEGAHEMAARDVDFSKTNQHLLASGGDDCHTCVWDLRKPSDPVVKVSSHSHWVWQARFNPYHEQLLLTSSSDSLVQLWNLAQDEEDGNKTEARASSGADLKPHTFDEHEDSVYSVSWSTADPWTFLTLSYDGRVMCNQVPSSVKYKILL